MTAGCYETSLLVFANARRAGTLLTVKCPAPGTHRETNARGLPGEMLAAGIESHIRMPVFPRAMFETFKISSSSHERSTITKYSFVSRNG